MWLPSKSTTFVILLLFSAATALLLPTSWTGGLRGLFQPVAIVQWVTSIAARDASASVKGVVPVRIAQEDALRYQQENELLRRLLQDQQAQTEALAAQVAEISGIRDQWPDSHARIILAHVVSYDASRRRESLQVALDAQTVPLVQRGQWVVAGLPETPTRETVGGRWIIGQVADVQTRLARVQLTSDIEFRARVRVGALTERGWVIAPDECLLEGLGGGRMMISDAIRDYYAAGYQMVLLPSEPAIPIRISIGRITGSVVDPESSKHYNLNVAPWGGHETLTHVYIIATP